VISRSSMAETVIQFKLSPFLLQNSLFRLEETLMTESSAIRQLTSEVLGRKYSREYHREVLWSVNEGGDWCNRRTVLKHWLLSCDWNRVE
jgi:hypothetical protein